MFLKPKTSQLNYLATLYKETLDITRYINATTVFRTLLSNSTYKYWVYDTDNACMVEIENKDYDIYTINEALYRNIPVIVTPLPYLEEIGYKDGKTGYTLKFDCSNLNEIVEKIQKIPSFNFVPL